MTSETRHEGCGLFLTFLGYLLLEVSKHAVRKPEQHRKGTTWKGTEAEPWPLVLQGSVWKRMSEP